MKHMTRNQKKGWMYPLIINYLQGSMSQKDFCSMQNLTIRKFQYWYRRYKRELPSDNKVFVPIKFDTTPVEVKSPDEMKICYPNGVVVQLQVSTPNNILKTLISLI
jgi:hypothetical protein